MPVVVLLALAGASAKPPVTAGEADPVMKDLSPLLIETLNGPKDVGGTIGPEASLADLLALKPFRAIVAEHKLKLFGGPMVGCLSDSGATVWVRTLGEAEVRVIASPRADLSDPVRSAPVRSTRGADLTAVVKLTALKPFTKYHYDVLVDGVGVLGPKYPAFRTAPAKGQKVSFKIGFGGGARYVPKHEHMWDTIAAADPLAFLFLGDNIYIDKPRRRDVQRSHYYHRQLRPEYRRMTASTGIYAIWDDHDFGKNDCSGGPKRFDPDWKLPAWKVFRENWNNPYYGGGETQPGCWFDFSLGDVDFFMTDGRYYRAFGDGTMLGPVQKKWLLAKLKASKATFKVIASGTLWTQFADKGGKDSWEGVQAEREEIFSLINEARLDGVILLSADRHRSEIWKIDRPKGYPLYEFESSKLTNMHTHRTREQAVWSYNKGNFFGLLTFDLTTADPSVTFECVNIQGASVHSLKLPLSELSHR